MCILPDSMSCTAPDNSALTKMRILPDRLLYGLAQKDDLDVAFLKLDGTLFDHQQNSLMFFQDVSAPCASFLPRKPSVLMMTHGHSHLGAA
eukprot:1162134-Pelagomonas_calceolata.AAC.7